MVKIKKSIENEAQKRLDSKPSNRVRIVVMVDREKARIYKKYETIQNFINVAYKEAFRRKKNV